MRRVLFITGSRSDYDIQRSILLTVKDRMEPQLIVTGAHLAKLHGDTESEIVTDALAPITVLHSWVPGDQRMARAQTLGVQIAALSETIPRLAPDLILVPMDREEALAIATVGAYLDIPLFHLGGGDLTGDGIDDRIRHAVSRLSHFHLTHTEKAAERLVAQGESPWRVKNVGAPGLDRWRGAKAVSLADGPYALLIQHPNFGSKQTETAVALEALLEVGIPVWIGDPNSDPQREAVMAVNQDFCRRYPQQFRHYGNLPREEFQTLLAGAAVLIGNSSCGIVEAPFLKVPTIDLGPRQHGRAHGASVVSLSYDRESLVTAIRRAVFDNVSPKDFASPYGDGNASERIAKLLIETPLDKKLRHKEFA